MHGILEIWLALCSTGVILAGEPLTLEQAAREAETIISCRVVKATPRWGDASRRWIETEYTVEILDTPLPTDTIEKGARLNIVVWGGTIGDETQQISDLPYMEAGKSYVLMLRDGWAGADQFSPMVGFCQGFFPVVADDQSDRSIVVDYCGRPVYAVADGARLALSAESKDVASRKRVTPAQLIEVLRGDLRRIQALPARELPVRLARAEGEEKLPRKKLATRRQSDVSPQRIETSAPRAKTVKGLVDPPEPAKAVLVKGDGDPQPIDSHEHHEHDDVVKGFAKYTNALKIGVPVTINQFTADMTPWSPVDEECMAIWNYYADVIFVRDPPSADCAYGDGVCDLHGWLTNAEMQDRFGTTWPAEAAAMCPQRVKNGVILEADIAFNDHLEWTLKDEAYVDGQTGDREAFRATLLHELGHLLGLDHVQGHALMYLSSVKYYDGMMRPMMDDAQGVRASYPQYAKQINDLGVYLFYHKDGKWSGVTMPATVARGASLTVTNYMLENVGTTTVSAPAVEFYLCTQRNFNTTYHYLGTATYPTLTPFNFFDPPSATRSFTVPSGTPVGDYYLGAYIRDDQSYGLGVFPFSNSMAFSRKKIQVQ